MPWILTLAKPERWKMLLKSLQHFVFMGNSIFRRLSLHFQHHITKQRCIKDGNLSDYTGKRLLSCRNRKPSTVIYVWYMLKKKHTMHGYVSHCICQVMWACASAHCRLYNVRLFWYCMRSCPSSLLNLLETKEITDNMIPRYDPEIQNTSNSKFTT